jgi:hypothetical protein
MVAVRAGNDTHVGAERGEREHVALDEGVATSGETERREENPHPPHHST